MLFQTLDDKTECVGIYADSKLMFDVDQFPEELRSTWSYSPYLRGMDIDFASLYLEGKPISDVIPEFLHDDWNDVSEKILAFKRSLSISKVNQDENCFFDLVPERFLTDFCEVKNSITRHVLNTITVRYNQFGTVTGRLTTKKNSFPILTLNKSLRHAIKPKNDYFVELDFNGAEVRTLLGMLGSNQPSGDVHDFHLAKVFGPSTTREQAKTLFFSWLYGSKKMSVSPEGKKLESFYERERLLDEFYDDCTVTTPFGKIISGVDKHVALNYLVQSTTAELTLKQALKIDYLLRRDGTGSNISFLIHDAIVLDMKSEDEWLLSSIKKLMSSTNFGKFVINTKSGVTLGTMREDKVG
jgi:hypothetical protein